MFNFFHDRSVTVYSQSGRGPVVDTSYSVHGGRTTVTEVVRPSPIIFIHASVVEASRIGHRRIRESRDGSVTAPRRLRDLCD